MINRRRRSSCHTTSFFYMKTYTELMTLSTYRERLLYLREAQKVGEETFGFDRHINQAFYKSPEWRNLRWQIILRDKGSDLGDEDRPILGKVIIHHINPIRPSDFKNLSDSLMNPENLICVSKETHNAIHYGFEILEDFEDRKEGDTKLW